MLIFEEGKVSKAVQCPTVFSDEEVYVSEIGKYPRRLSDERWLGVQEC